MNLEQLISGFRTRTGDLAAPYLWDDPELIGYANDAQEDACRRAHLLVDSTGDLSVLDLAVGDSLIELDDRVIAIRRARTDASSIPLMPRISRLMDELLPGWDTSTVQSIPRVFVPDYQTQAIKLYPVVNAAMKLYLTVVRLPMKSMEAAADEPEIRSRYHDALIDGMMARAYLKQDADAFDKDKSDRAEESFTSTFGPPVSAVSEQWAMEQYYDVGET